MLELYGWESVFYISGILAVLWAYSMWKCMLNGEGNCNNVIIRLKELVWARVLFWHPVLFFFLFLVATASHACWLHG